MARLPIARSIAIALLVAGIPQASSAQFGALKKLKNAISPDSAAKVEAAKEDSIALAAKVARGDTTPLERSKFSRAVSAAGAASDKFEQVTGVSTKDAALAATGVGAGGIIAKKLGVDPMSLGAQAMNMGQQRAQSRAAGVAGMPGMPSIPGMPDMSGLLNMQKMSQTQGRGADARLGVQALTGNSMLGFTEADAQAVAAFQQEMMKVAMAASAGDVAAQARLESWQAIALKYEPEIEKLAIAAQGGDMTAVQKLQVIQINLIREWAGMPAVKATKVTKPVKAAKP